MTGRAAQKHKKPAATASCQQAGSTAPAATQGERDGMRQRNTFGAERCSYACQGIRVTFPGLISGVLEKGMVNGRFAGLRTRQGRSTRVRESSYEVTPSRSEMRPGTADESFEGQQVRGSRLSGQAVPGALGVIRRPGGGGDRPRGRRNASGSG